MTATSADVSAADPSAAANPASAGPPSEDALDRLTRLAAGLLRAPVALVALVAEGRPVLARALGLAEARARELPAAHPLWARTIASGEAVAVEDGRSGDNPLTGRSAEQSPDGSGGGGEAELAAWLGVPLVAPGRGVVGCLCVAAPQPRAWTDAEVALLRDLAGLAGAAMGPDAPGRGDGQGAGRAVEGAVLDSIPHACFALDRQWRFTYLGPRAQRLFDQLSRRRHGPLLGRIIWDECPEVADSAFARECQQALAEQRPGEVEVFYPGLNRWFTVRVAPIPDGLCVFLQDVSERTGLERALAHRAAQLAEADRGKDEFLVQLAHEVRNALAPVRNALHLTQARGLDDPEDERACALAEAEVRRLSRLMDDLLKVAQLIPGHVLLRKERVNLAEVVARAVTAALSSAAGRSLTVDLPQEPMWLKADPEQLEQALSHLLENAAKFTRPGGHIRLSAERDRGAVLRVRDDGVGMSAEMLPLAFNLFMRGERGPARFQGGMGIGLTLVRRLVELHGGSVEARSDGPDQGSEFIVRLPGLEQAEPEPPEEQAEDDRRLRVLVVDDSRDTAQSLACMVERWGHEVRVAYDGPSALAMARVQCPDVVLLDIGMPGMDGYEVARGLRECEPDEKLVLVAVTGYGQEEDRSLARAAGFDYHMVKPVDPRDLKELLAAWDAARQGPSGAAG
jgi:signal transduction histidine kinase/ActR/RegA family two-component response regulator